ncbi:hypothetical protein ABTK82_20540, partial [Acinetobacter baumannii]
MGDPINPDTTPSRTDTTAPAAPKVADAARPDATRAADATYSRKDLLSAGEGVFGKGAQGL